MVLLVGSIWGSSFLFIAIGLDALAPPVIAFLRIFLGTLALLLFPRARRPIDREDLRHVALLGVVWMGVPFLLIPIAQQWVASAVAGMLNGAVPVFSAVIASVLSRTLPGKAQSFGLLSGFVGVAFISVSTSDGLGANLVGVALLIVSYVMFGLAANIAVPLQQRYGALPVILRAQVVALVLLLPFALAGIGGSMWSWPSIAAMFPLGFLSTGVAFAAMATLVGRTGAYRGTIGTYLIPVVAMVLGVVFRDEVIGGLAVLGTGLVVLGAWLASRREIAHRGMGEQPRRHR